MNERANRIRRAIESSAYSYHELAKITGISKSSLQRYATGAITKIPIDNIEEIAKATGAEPQYLMGWDLTDSTDDILTEHDVPNGTVVYHRNGQAVTEHLTPEQLDMLAKMIKAIKMDDNDEL